VRKSRLSESKQKLASCLPSVSDYYGAKLHENAKIQKYKNTKMASAETEAIIF